MSNFLIFHFVIQRIPFLKVAPVSQIFLPENSLILEPIWQTSSVFGIERNNYFVHLRSCSKNIRKFQQSLDCQSYPLELFARRIFPRSRFRHKYCFTHTLNGDLFLFPMDEISHLENINVITLFTSVEPYNPYTLIK